MTGLHIKRLLRSSQLIRLKRKSGNGKIHSVNLFSHKHTRPKEEGFILIFIMSAPFNTILRLAIRQTWLSILADNSAAAQDHPNIRAVKDLTNSSNTSLVQFFFVCGHGHQRVESAVGCQWDRNLRRHFKAEMYGEILIASSQGHWLLWSLPQQQNNTHYTKGVLANRQRAPSPDTEKRPSPCADLLPPDIAFEIVCFDGLIGQFLSSD